MNAQDKIPVLFIAYLYPPMGGGGVQRTAKFVKFLKQGGWDPHVLTARSVIGPQKDASLCVEEDAERLLRIASPYESLAKRGGAGSRILARLLEKVSVPDGAAAWARLAEKPAADLIRRSKIRLIYATGGPFSNFILGARLARRIGLPLVLDYRDPWGLSPFRNPSALGKIKIRLEFGLERIALKRADRVILNTPSAERLFLNAFPGMRGRTRVIPNGFDGDEFGPRGSESGAGKKEFVLLHAGSFLFYRRPDVFFEAAARLKGRDGGFRDAMKIFLAGKEDPGAADCAERFGLRDKITFEGYLAHAELVKRLYAADVLVLIMEPVAEGASMTVPGKLFEYIGAGKPILALAPNPSDARDILDPFPHVRCADLADPEDVAEKLDDLFQNWKQGRFQDAYKDVPDYEAAIAPYTRRLQAMQLAELFSELVSL